MKKTIFVVFLVVFLLTSCGHNCEKDGHLWTVTDRVESTCIEQGVENKTCSVCGAVETETLLLEEHKWEVVEAVPATCITEGVRKSVCSVCQKEMVETLPLSNHLLDVVEHVDNTCISDGYTKYRCSVCSEEFEELLLKNPDKHLFVETILSPATCTSDGAIEYECEVCGCSGNRIVAARGHDFYKDKCLKCGLLDDIPDDKYEYAGLYVLKEEDEWGYPTGDSEILLLASDASYTDAKGMQHDTEIEIIINPVTESIQFAFFAPDGSGISLGSYIKLRYRSISGKTVVVPEENIGRAYSNAVMLRDRHDFYVSNSTWYDYDSDIFNPIISEILSSGKVPFILESLGEDNRFNFTVECDPVLLSRLIEKYGGTVILDASGTSFTVPISFSTIPEEHFRDCTGIKSIAIPEPVTSIGDYAFRRCSNLTEVRIASGVSSIGEYAFFGCKSLTEIEIPSSMTSIGDYAFSGCSLTEIEIPSSVTSIGDYAFSGCSSLTKVEIPSSVTSIGDYAFSSCSSLTEVEIPSNVTSIEFSTFSGCTNLKEIEIPSSVTSIGDYAFFGCSSLTKVEIPSSVTSIGMYAFEGCSSLTKVEIPSSVTTIWNSAFKDCSNLTEVKIASGVKFISGHAFSGCSSLTKVEIPSSVTSIENYAFFGCSSLTEVELPASIIQNTAGWRMDGIFGNCDNLKTIVIHGEVNYIPDDIKYFFPHIDFRYQ